jgi:hypothetical protein
METIITGEGKYRDENGDVWEYNVATTGHGKIRMFRDNGRFVAWYTPDGMPADGFKDYPRIISRIPDTSEDTHCVPVETWKAGDECEWHGGKYKVLAVATPRVCTCAWIVNDEGRFETVETCDLRRPVKRREWTVVDATFKGTDMISVTLECTGNIEWSAEKNELIVAALNASEDGAK